MHTKAQGHGGFSVLLLIYTPLVTRSTSICTDAIWWAVCPVRVKFLLCKWEDRAAHFSRAGVFGWRREASPSLRCPLLKDSTYLWLQTRGSEGSHRCHISHGPTCHSLNLDSQWLLQISCQTLSQAWLELFAGEVPGIQWLLPSLRDGSAKQLSFKLCPMGWKAQEIFSLPSLPCEFQVGHYRNASVTTSHTYLSFQSCWDDASTGQQDQFLVTFLSPQEDFLETTCFPAALDTLYGQGSKYKGIRLWRSLWWRSCGDLVSLLPRFCKVVQNKGKSQRRH